MLSMETYGVNAVAKNYKGFALVEILVALTVLSITVIAFTGLLTHSFSGIFEAGKKSDALYTAQDNMENKIAKKDGSGQKLDLVFGSQYTVWGKELDETKYKTFVSDSSARIRFVTVGEDGTVCGSPNGIEWKEFESNVSDDLYDVTWGGIFEEKKYVAVGSDGVIITSPDGISLNWVERVSGTGEELNAVAWGGPTESDDLKKFVIVGNNIVLVSTNGETWENKDTENPLGFFDDLELKDVIWSESLGLFVAVGKDGVIITSSNGEVWSKTTMTWEGAAPHLYGVTWGQNKLITIGNLPSNEIVIMTSLDGITWETQYFTDDALVNGITWGGAGSGGLFVMVGENGISTLPFGSEWGIDNEYSLSIFNGVTWGYNMFTSVGNNGDICTSLDGSSWEERDSNVLKHFYGITNADTGL
ncbi:MAG: hypothetical protein VR67_01670 [Peptococcaceae bacterium BRH_c8a]|nr:MAG: hypothetical protein VR67_01670 [Peptococcaceae bacterium BRH_c8a]